MKKKKIVAGATLPSLAKATYIISKIVNLGNLNDLILYFGVL